MRYLLSTTALASTAALALTMGMGSPAHADDCMEELTSLNQRISQKEHNYRVSMTAEAAREVRELRNAARILQKNGQEESCEEVVESIESIMKKHNEQMVTSSEGGGGADEWQEREKKRLQQARPVTELSSTLWAAEIIGSDVRNRMNEDLGEVTDVIIDPKNGDIAYAVVTHGGFLGLGEDEVAVPWKQLHVTPDLEVVVLDVTEEQLDNAPEIDRDEKGRIEDPQWRDQTQTYFQSQSEKEG